MTMLLTLSAVAPSPRFLSVALWTAQALLFLLFAATGTLKSAMPIGWLAPRMSWVRNVPPFLVRCIGFVELAGAIGVIAPSSTRILPWLTPLAAMGLAVAMLIAAGVHIAKREVAQIGVPLLVGALSVFVVWGRSTAAPIARRELVPPTAVSNRSARLSHDATQLARGATSRTEGRHDLAA